VNEDQLRELAKIQDSLTWAINYHTKLNESNAALHKSDRVLYSPLTVSLINAKESVDRLMED
jgi:hypothetical protein